MQPASAHVEEDGAVHDDGREAPVVDDGGDDSDNDIGDEASAALSDHAHADDKAESARQQRIAALAAEMAQEMREARKLAQATIAAEQNQAQTRTQAHTNAQVKSQVGAVHTNKNGLLEKSTRLALPTTAGGAAATESQQDLALRRALDATYADWMRMAQSPSQMAQTTNAYSPVTEADTSPTASGPAPASTSAVPQRRRATWTAPQARPRVNPVPVRQQPLRHAVVAAPSTMPAPASLSSNQLDNEAWDHDNEDMEYTPHVPARVASAAPHPVYRQARSSTTNSSRGSVLRGVDTDALRSGGRRSRDGSYSRRRPCSRSRSRSRSCSPERSSWPRPCRPSVPRCVANCGLPPSCFPSCGVSWPVYTGGCGPCSPYTTSPYGPCGPFDGWGLCDEPCGPSRTRLLNRGLCGGCGVVCGGTCGAYFDASCSYLYPGASLTTACGPAGCSTLACGAGVVPFLYGVAPVCAPATTSIGTAVDTVCSGGTCATVTQPTATTCNVFGCATTPIGPPNLASIVDRPGLCRL